MSTTSTGELDRRRDAQTYSQRSDSIDLVWGPKRLYVNRHTALATPDDSFRESQHPALTDFTFCAKAQNTQTQKTRKNPSSRRIQRPRITTDPWTMWKFRGAHHLHSQKFNSWMLIRAVPIMQSTSTVQVTHAYAHYTLYSHNKVN